VQGQELEMKLRTVLLILALLAFLSASVGGYLCYSLTGSASILGVSFPIFVLVVLLYSEGKRAIIRDISGRNRAEEEVGKLNEELEERVIERSAELVRANEQLRQEIEERKRAEGELSLQKTYFQHLFDNSPEASVILDDEDRIVDINKEFEKLFHYSIEEIKGKFINDLIVSEDLLDEARSLTQKTLQGQVVKKQTVRKRKGGSLVDVSILGYPITFNGKQIGVYAVYKDITERKQAEEALKDSEREYRNLVDNALVGIYKTDLEGNILYVNEALIKMMENRLKICNL
jgi:PAS domain S-box-containing protein